ncbi:MAG: hypothetical protein IT477_08510 [Rhodanobacteraceae bacterium]|nr:hypothetical protein [Rhodanobacteraceae bacterium]
MSAELQMRVQGGPPMLVLGPPQLRAPGAIAFVRERRFQLLAVLALRSGQWVARDELAALLWSERPNADARRNLRHVIFKARALPGVRDLEASGQAPRWNVVTDLLAFEEALRGGRPLEAMACRRGRVLEGIDDPDNAALGEWLAAQRAQVDARWHQAAQAALEAASTPPRRIDVARRMLELDPPRRNHAPGDEPAGVHAAACGAGARRASFGRSCRGRFYGVFAPNAKLRPLVVPQGPEQEQATEVAGAGECEAETAQARPHRISWAQLLKRVFSSEIT